MKRDYPPNLLPTNALHILLNKLLRNLTQFDPIITMQLFFIVLQMNLQRNLLIPVSKIDEIVTKCGDNWPNIKIILSLATPRLDNLNVKVELTNALVKNKFHNVGNVFVCDNSNLSHRGTPQRKFIDHQRDNYHLNNSGVAQLSANMKSTICAALNIPMFHKQQHPTNKQWNRNQQNKKQSWIPPKTVNKNSNN